MRAGVLQYGAVQMEQRRGRGNLHSGGDSLVF